MSRSSPHILIVVAVLSLSACGPAPLPAPQVLTGGSKVGLHIVPGPRTGYGAFLNRIAAAGRRVPVVKAVDDLSPLDEVERLMPDTITVGRLNSVTDPTTGVSWDLQAFKPSDFPSARVAAETYWFLVASKWLARPHIDAWETFNEFSSDWGWQGQFYIELMKLVEPAGIKLVLYAFSTGNPPESAIPEIIPALRLAQARGHYLSVHEYGGVPPAGVTDWPDTLRGSDPFHALRYRSLYAALPEDARPQLIISEVGQSGGCCFIGVTPFIEDFAWYDSRLQDDPYVIGATAWTLGRWGNANFQEALPALADYIIAFEPPVTLGHEFYLPLVIRE